MRRILIFIAFFVSILSLISCGDRPSVSAPEDLNPGLPADIQLVATQYIVQTNSDAFFMARVLDGTKPLSGVAVTFTNISPIGTINAASVSKTGSVSKSGTTVAYTNSLGWATARIFSSTPGFVTVQAEVDAGTGHVRERKTIYFTTSNTLNLQPTLTLDVDAEGDGSWNEGDDFIMLQNTGDDFVLIRVTVRDRFGLLTSGVTVTFGADVAYRVGSDPAANCSDGSTNCEITFNTDTVTTDSSGEATVMLQASPETLRSIQTLFNVTATADNGAAGLVTLFLDPVTIASVSMSANPGVVLPLGTSKITAFVSTDPSGIAPDNTAVMFTTTCGSVTPFGQTTDGSAPATFTAPSTEGPCTITGTASGVSGSVDVIVSAVLRVVPAQQMADNILGETATFTIYGGTPPYSIFQVSGPTFPPAPATVPASGGTFDVVIPPGTPTGVAKYDIYDAVGAKVTATLNIGSDSTGPSVISTVPVDTATGVAPNSNVTITWDEDVDCATVNTTTITIDSGGWALSSCSGNQAVFTTSGQTTVTTYTVTVTTAVTDLVANPMSADYTFSYTTAALSVVSTVPANTATGVVLNSNVTITWNAAVDCATVTTTNVTIAPAPATWTQTSCIGNSATFTPTGQTASTLYTVTVGTGVTDLAANPMLANYPFSYTTAP